MNRLVEEVEGLADKFGKVFAGRSVLVTGGAGFIGSWICDVLAKAGAEVICIDNFSSGRRSNISHLEGKIKLVEGRVESSEVEEKCDIIFHLASRASPEDYQMHPVDTLRTNSLGTLRVLEKAARDMSRVVYASTSEVYGDAKVVPTPETYNGNVNPVGPRSCYDEGKRFGEALCVAFFRERRLDVRIVRIFNTYGPRIREDGYYGRALPRFISQALVDRPVTVYGDGKQTRSFCYITDTVEAILRISLAEGLSGEVFNVGNPEEISILELAKRVIEKTRSRSEIAFMPAIQDDPRRRCPDIRKIGKMVGWKPKITLDYGLERTVEYLKGSN